MADVTIGGATYNGVEQVDIPLASGAGNASYYLNGGGAFVPYNVNLLDNADWFAYIINQRGNMTYSGLLDAYGIDRWRTTGSITVYNPTSADVGYVALANGGVMKQRMEILPSALIGKTVTAAVDIGGTVHSDTVTFPASGEETVFYDGGVTVAVGIDSGTYNLCNVSVSGVPYIEISANANVNVRRVWLELGNVCHMETTPPKNYAENLAVCQRYFISISSALAVLGFVSNGAKTYYMFVPIPVPLRSTPAVTLSGWRGRKTVSPGYLVYTGNTYKAPTTISVNYSPGATSVRITDTIGSAVDENNQLAQYEFSGLEISAEL